MRFFTFCILWILISTNSQARQFQLGINNGIGCLNNMNGFYGDKRISTWDRGVYVRYVSNKRLAIEFGMYNNNWKFDTFPRFDMDLFETSDIIFIHSTDRFNVWSGNISIQYEITPNSLIRNYTIFSRLKSYLSLSTSRQFVKSNTEYTSFDIKNSRFYHDSYSNSFQQMVYGFDYTICYALSNHFETRGSLGVKFTWDEHPFLKRQETAIYTCIWGIAYVLGK